MASIQQMFSQLGAMYGQLSLGRKVSFVLFLLIGIGAFSTLIMVAKQPDFRVLLTDLTVEDANTVISNLKENRVPYKLTNGGTTVMVPSANYYDVKMQLAGEGLPQGGMNGFELFDKKSLGMTDFQQSVNYQRALQGELARTIKQLGPVENCRVHLALPKESLFKEDQRRPTASVVVQLNKNARLNEEQIDAVVFLISGSVEGLDPSNVTVIDSKGRVLSKKEREDMAGPVNGAMLDYKRKVENNLEHSIVSLLAKSVGVDKISARVSADIDFRQVTKTEERYDPESQVARSEQSVTEKNDESQSANSGAPGTDANMPDEPTGGQGENSSSTAEKHTETINYEITRVVSQISEPVGEIKKLSIAVMVDGTYKKGDDGQLAYVTRTDEEMNKFALLVKKSIGFSAERGDQLEVVNIPFSADESFQTADLIGDGKREMIFTIVNYSLIGLGLILFFLFALRPLINWLTAEPSYNTAAELAGMLPSGIGALENRLLGGAAAPKALPEADETTLAQQNKMQQLHQRRKSLMESAERDKKAIAAMLKKWLSEDSE